jgi:hypothetical protein
MKKYGTIRRSVRRTGFASAKNAKRIVDINEWNIP